MKHVNYTPSHSWHLDDVIGGHYFLQLLCYLSLRRCDGMGVSVNFCGISPSVVVEGDSGDRIECKKKKKLLALRLDVPQEVVYSDCPVSALCALYQFPTNNTHRHFAGCVCTNVVFEGVYGTAWHVGS